MQLKEKKVQKKNADEPPIVVDETPVKVKKSKKKEKLGDKNVSIIDVDAVGLDITAIASNTSIDNGDSVKKKSKKRKTEEEGEVIELKKTKCIEEPVSKVVKVKKSKKSEIFENSEKIEIIENGEKIEIIENDEKIEIIENGDAFNNENQVKIKKKKNKKELTIDQSATVTEIKAKKLKKPKKENFLENDSLVKTVESKISDDKKIIGDDEEDDDDPGSFKKYSISNYVAEKLREQGIKKLFPVQYESYSDIMNGTDVILQSRTGSGKTFSFGIPLIEKLHASQMQTDPNVGRYGRAPQVLVLAPTRELSKQVADSLSSIANDKTSVLCVYGGTPVYPQERALQNGVDILVGTPGRIQDLIDRGACDLSSLKHVVLDEVDRMLDMGFADDVDKILQIRYSSDGTTGNPQTLFFSATLPAWVQQTASKYLNNNVKRINLIGHGDVRTSKTVQHLAIQCSYQDRAATINSVVRVYSGNQGRAMIFCKTKKDADELALSSDLTIDAHVIHGDVPQEKRELVLKCFREGKYRCLIATDVAARGLDIPEVDLVIQCSPPQDVESYIHRSGRTGRAGRTGTCVLFYKRFEERELRMVEQRANIKLKMVGPPTPSDIMKAAAEDAAKIMASVSKEASDQFTDLAKRLIDERGAVMCLSEALAVISGNQEIKQRSLLSSKEGFVTFVYRTTSWINYLSFVWNALQRFIDQEMKEAITGMRFCKDRMGVIFDIPADKANQLESAWVDGKNDTLRRAETLPELEQQPDHGNRFQGGGRGRFGGGGFRRGGGYGGWRRNN